MAAGKVKSRDWMMSNNQNVLDSLLAASLREAKAGNGLEKWWRRWDEERGCVEKQAINRVQDRPRPQDRAKNRRTSGPGPLLSTEQASSTQNGAKRPIQVLCRALGGIAAEGSAAPIAH